MMQKSVVLGLLAALLSTPAWSQVSIYLGIAPPPVRFEAPPPPPAPAFIWVAGFWAPEGGHYRWIEGHYERPPYPGAYWYAPRYEQGPRGWGYRHGYWGRREIREEHGRGHAYGHYKERDDDRGREHDHDHGHGHGHDD
jgi:WXXGXW repeat (2 copies)